MKKVAFFLVMAAVISITAPAFGDMGADDGIIVADVIFVRPVSLAAVVVGTALFIVALPFSIPSGSVELTAQVLVVEPFKYTFQRPIGYPYWQSDPAVNKEP